MPALTDTMRSRSASYDRLSLKRKLPKTFTLGVVLSGWPAWNGCEAAGAGVCAWAPEDAEPLGEARAADLRQITDYDRSGSSFISHELADLERPRVAALKAQGATLLTWTVRSPADEAFARRFVDNITFEGYAAPFPT